MWGFDAINYGSSEAPKANMEFDLIEWLEKSRKALKPDLLYQIWDKACGLKDKGKITNYELEELKAVIFPKLAHLEGIKRLTKGENHVAE